MKRISLYFTCALLVFTTVGISLAPALTVSAATPPSDAAIEKAGENSAACKGASSDSGDIKICAGYYLQGYKNPNQSSQDFCKNVGITLGLCYRGYPAGQQERKTIDSQSNNGSGTGSGGGSSTNGGALTDAQISALGQTNSACAQFKDSFPGGFADCVSGYIGGYKGQSQSSVCGSAGSPGLCNSGYAAGESDKTANVTTLAQQITASNNNSTNNNNLSLSCHAGFNPLNWLICSIVQGMVSIIGVLDNAINSQLSVGSDGTSDAPNQIFADSNGNCSGNTGICDAYYKAWASFRDIALGLMVIAGLLVLIAQSLGMEILDAYTIRKILPRLLLAALSITLSWQLMQFFVTLTNDLGFGIRHLIYAPFIGINTSIHLNFIQGVPIIAGIGAAALGVFGLLSIAGMGALAVFVAFMVLVLRQIAIIMLIILAPIGIVAYILPNTQRVYKLWWESFSKALLMFPIIAGFIAAGRVFSAIALNQSGGILSQMVGFIAYFAPYFMIPMTFRFAGATMGALGGFVTSAARPGFDALRKRRAETSKRNRAELASGNRLKGTEYEGGILGQYSKFARQVNRGSKGAANAKNAGFNPRRWKDRMGAASATATDVAAREAREKNEAIKALDGDDDLLHVGIEASQGNHGDDWVRQQLEAREYTNVDQGVALVRAARRSANRDVFEQAAIPMLFGSKSGLTPKYQTDADGNVMQDADGNDIILSGAGEGGAGEGRALIVKSARGDQQRVIKMLGQSREMAERTARHDLLGGSYTEDLATTLAMQDKHLSGGGINDADMQEVTNRTSDGALDGMSRGQMLAGHKRSVVVLSKRMATRIREAATVVEGAERPGQAEDAFSQYASLGATVDAASSAGAEKIAIIKKDVLDDVVNVGTLPKQVQQELGDSLFQTKTVQQIDPRTGAATEVTVPDKTKPKETMTNAEIKEGLQNYSPTYGRYKREYTRASDAYAASHSGPPENPEGA